MSEKVNFEGGAFLLSLHARRMQRMNAQGNIEDVPVSAPTCIFLINPLNCVIVTGLLKLAPVLQHIYIGHVALSEIIILTYYNHIFSNTTL